jgi:hypothetical protein
LADKSAPHPLQTFRCRALLEFEELKEKSPPRGLHRQEKPAAGGSAAMDPSTSNDRREQRQLELTCLMAKQLIEINGKLTDIATLIQQQVDLLRRILSQERKP